MPAIKLTLYVIFMSEVYFTVKIFLWNFRFNFMEQSLRQISFRLTCILIVSMVKQILMDSIGAISATLSETNFVIIGKFPSTAFVFIITIFIRKLKLRYQYDK